MLFSEVLGEDMSTVSGSVCRLDGCKRAKWRALNGKLHEYCCKEHAEKAKMSCELGRSIY